MRQLMIAHNSSRAQKIHKSIFETMLVDLVPFHEVNKPGFLRHHALVCPNFEVASDKYYRDMLDPTYERVKSRVKERLNSDSPPSFSIALDGWSQYHHGYMGINAHYLDNEWDRQIVCISCSPFDESHTGIHYIPLTSSEFVFQARLKHIYRMTMQD